jgi:diadenylate cyclase
MSGFFESLRWQDLVDILAVALVIYYLLLLIRGTRAVQILLGILLLAFVYWLASLVQLVTLQQTLQYLFAILPFAILVLFQSQIRRALADFGPRLLLSFAAGAQVEPIVSDIVVAAKTLASRGVGALIVFERHEGLRDYIESGIPLDAVPSFDLLISLFNPSTPLHDGAVIVQNNRLAAAACFLPLSPNPELSTQFGTRHRAALGISEETDALAVVVSEETSRIAVAVGGEMIQDLDSRGLRNTLYEYLVSDRDAKRKKAS